MRGAHTYKAGFEIRQMKYPNFNFTYTAGEYALRQLRGRHHVGNVSNYTTQTSLNGTTVSSGFAGFGFASFLLGGAQAIADERAHQPPDARITSPPSICKTAGKSIAS